MSQVELIWGAFSLMLLGALVTMCMKCQRSGGKQDVMGLDSQRNQCDNQQRFEVAPSYSMSGQECAKMPYNLPVPSKRSQHPFTASHLEEACAEPTYQHFEKELRMEQETAYIEPISTDHCHSCRKFVRLPSDEDACCYQNVAGPSKRSGCILEDVDIYENSTIIQLWKHSQTTENSDDDDDSEPYYINADPNGRFAA
ncbi:linker for activation of T-cells family member 2 [Rhineura floridana]|uniref:linker for activation of T-cells family member 2 n=1 Tax=Rhineura floridana TaxID=261503 RepID=UPI002AC803FF|nr:linker for activation of T-cells family member 2 [Rhineura floridana]